MPTGDDSAMDLLRAAQAGDRAAVAGLVTELLPQVRAMVHRRLEQSYRRHNDWVVSLFSTGDVVQDLLIGVLADLGRFRGADVRSLTAWLSAQVESRILERLRFFRSGKRDQRRVASLERSPEGAATAAIADPHASPAASAAAAELWSALQEAIAGLAEDERAVVEKSLDPEVSWEDVARELGLPSGEAARQRHKRARARLSLRLSARFPELFARRPPEEHGSP
jgi:RNA polymerase sigma factor (sigma-70 family)